MYLYKMALVLLAGVVSLATPAQRVFDFNAACVKAYYDVMSLRLAPAAEALRQQKAANPNNLAPILLENYIDFFELFLNEDPVQYQNKKKYYSERLKLLEDGPQHSPLTLFSQAVVHLQWAAIELKFANKWAAGWAFRDAFKLAAQNKKKHPGFAPNLMITGPMQMMAGTIPKGYKWLGNLMGISGTVAQGQQDLGRFLASNDAWATMFRNEGIFYQVYMQYYLLNQPDEALQFIYTQNLDLVGNHLFAFMAANLHLNHHESQKARQIVLGRRQAPEYLQTPIWDFELAYASLYQLQPQAETYFQRFLSKFKGNYYVKDAWLKLGWYYLIAGNVPRYNQCINMVKTKGNAESDADKRALREARQNTLPNTLLLKARLLSDGGLYTEALQVLGGKSSNDFDEESEKLEFSYRLARIYDELGRDEEALKTYRWVIQMGKNRKEYFAARAALQSGLIYEARGDCRQAQELFNECIGMEDHDFEDSLEQKAKAGMARCSKK
jgi:tetratricopeptide (TPR) repeat protein